MKNAILYSAVAVFIIASISQSCKKDEDKPKIEIYGSWLVLQTDSNGLQYHVELRFNENNSYDWMLLEDVPGHSDSHAEFTLDENILTIVSDPDCDGTGTYHITVDSDKLALIAQSDDCTPRAAALEYIWYKK
ncbi:MAG: hypothetical protein JEZ03_10470 [Bacteroidales bacterium]|nr:hypothetical protein [Bacteroidales bacterium]